MNSLIDIKEPLILASKSPRRAQLLRQIGLDFRVIAGDMAEKMDNSGEPAALAVALSLAKAQHVADKVAAGLVIGADTIVVLQEKFLGKPADREEAFTMLRYLSGRTHQVYTGFSICRRPGVRHISDVECTNVTFRDLSDEEIGKYLDLDHPYDKAGAYGIQDHSALFVEKIDGCYYNVVGFPLTKFYVRLKEFLNQGK